MMQEQQPFQLGQVDLGPKIEMPQAKPKGGMFGGGGKFGIKEALAFGLAGLVSRRNPMLLQGLMGMMQQKGQSEQQEQQYQRQRNDGMQDWIAKETWKATNGGPDEFGQMMQQGGIDPHSPEGQALYRQLVQNKANPFTQMRVANPDGSETLQFMRSPTVPTAPVGRLRPLEEGGPSLGGSGGFL